MINLLVTLNSGYLNPLCAMLCSITKSNPAESFSLYVAHSSLTDDDFTKIHEAVFGYDFKIISIELDNAVFSDAPTEKRITKETYYRIFAPLYLPKEVDRILYIDPDTIVINPLSGFYNSNFKGNSLIAAKHFDGIIDSYNKKRLHMTKTEHYINAGIMLMNIEEMRKCFDKEKVFEIINRKKPKLLLADQDLINILYDGKIDLESEFIINLDERTYKKLPKSTAMDIVRKNTIIVHYNGKYKPWKPNYKGCLDCLWREFGFAPKLRIINEELIA